MNDVQYQVARKEDVSEIKNILFSVRCDSSKFNYQDFVVALKDKKVVGCIRLKNIDNDYYELSSLAVKPEYRNQKIGSQLISKIIDKKTEKIFLFCFKFNCGFYKKNGFLEINTKELPDTLKEELIRVKGLLPSNQKIIAMLFNKK